MKPRIAMRGGRWCVVDANGAREKWLVLAWRWCALATLYKIGY